MDERLPAREVQDTRRPAYGAGRLLVVLFAGLGLVILLPAVVALVRAPHTAPVVEAFNILGGLLYLLLAVCVAHNGRRMRNIGWMSLAALATMAVLIGALSLSSPVPYLEGSAWAHGGARLAYLPLIAPVVAAVWMWMSDPRRIVVNAERITELSDSLSERARAARSAEPRDQDGQDGAAGGAQPDTEQ
ncbi:hypothetical protein ACSL103130_03785 [Actinomyces slackii]|uniref:Integral membrane protein n=1 Tax=Actinomyces slackii TaxID=52774 RepID=A0A3S4U372_9ACTO|nr:hypothetical protein [Actinomyces slackii]VEG75375.1 Uncharacterised protein [Actinomyces slackii]